MRILFDQGTPVPWRHALVGHVVETAYEKGWSSLNNGDCSRPLKPRLSISSLLPIRTFSTNKPHNPPNRNHGRSPRHAGRKFSGTFQRWLPLSQRSVRANFAKYVGNNKLLKPGTLGFPTLSGTKVASKGGVKVLLGAAQSAGKSVQRGVSKAKPVVVRTKPFSFWQLAVWLLAITGAGALIYWIGKAHFMSFVDTGVFEVSHLEIGVLVFAVAALCWLVMQCWKYFDPYPELRISPGAAPLGSSFDVEWSFRGSKRRLRAIAMALEGREEVLAENKTGKHARAQKLSATFYVEQLDMLDRLDQGQIHVQVPEGLMPTFEGEKTRIVWLVRFENQIKWGARMKYEFPVQVLPEVAHG